MKAQIWTAQNMQPLHYPTQHPYRSVKVRKKTEHSCSQNHISAHRNINQTETKQNNGIKATIIVIGKKKRSKKASKCQRTRNWCRLSMTLTQNGTPALIWLSAASFTHLWLALLVASFSSVCLSFPKFVILFSFKILFLKCSIASYLVSRI